MTAANAKIAQQAYFTALDILYHNDCIDFAKLCELLDELDSVHYYVSSCIDYKLGYSQLQYHTSYSRVLVKLAHMRDGLRGVKQYLNSVQYTVFSHNMVSYRWTGLGHVMAWVVYTFLEGEYIDNTYLTERLAHQHNIALRDADHISAMYNGFHLQDGKLCAFLKISAVEV